MSEIRKRSSGSDKTFQYVVGFVAALFLLGILGTLFFGKKPVDQPTTLAQTSTTIPTTTTAAATSTSVDPHIGRPVYDEFLILSLLDADTGEFCRESFGSDTAACYDAYELGTDNFEELIVRNLEARTSSIPSYAPDQYGCQEDGRCLDDYGMLCDESEYESFEDEAGDTLNLCNPDY